MLEIVVHEIKGYCPVYKGGDRIVIDLDRQKGQCPSCNTDIPVFLG